MIKNKLFYSILYINSKKIPTSFIPNDPFIFTCDFDNEKVLIKQSNKALKNDITVYFNEIVNAELVICSRLRGAPISMLPTTFYNFDLIIQTNDNEFHIEFQANYNFKKVIDIFIENNVLFNDKLKVFDLFPDEQTFNKEYYNYFNKNFDGFAKEYNLDNPRVGYSSN